MIVVHCSATRCNHPYTVHQLYHDHVEVNHWRYIGYVADTRTGEQKKAMEKLIIQLKIQFPGIRTILGHRDLPGVQKACPSFDATTLQPLLHLNCKY